MKIDFRVILFTAFAWLISWVLLLWIFSLQGCSSAYHLDKFYDKGGKLDTITKIIRVTDTIKGKDGRDSIIFRDVPVQCPDPVIQTRWKTRIEWRYKTRIERIQSKSGVKLSKQLTKRSEIARKEAVRIAKYTKQTETANNKTINLGLIISGLLILTILAFKFSPNESK